MSQIDMLIILSFEEWTQISEKMFFFSIPFSLLSEHIAADMFLFKEQST